MKRFVSGLITVCCSLVTLSLVGCGSVGSPPDTDLNGQGQISGTVTVLGAPASGVSVAVYRDTGTSEVPEEVAQAETDPSGSYTVAGLAPGSYSLYARHGDYAGALPGVALGGDLSATAAISLVPAGSVSGRVTVEGDRGCEGVVVWVIGVPVWTMTDAAGEYTIEGIPMGTGYTVAATRAGCTLATWEDVTVDPGAAFTLPAASIREVTNHPPAISSVAAEATLVDPGGSVYLQCRANDADGDPLTYRWQVSAGACAPTNAWRVVWTAPNKRGPVPIIVYVTDGRGGTTIGYLSVYVTGTNQPPAVSSVAAESVLVDPGASTYLQCRASDADGDALTYSWYSSAGTYAATNQWRVNWTAPAVGGPVRIWVYVTDGRGGTTIGAAAVHVTEQNNPPAISAMTPANGSDFGPGSVVPCTVTAADADGDPLTYRWTATGGSFSGSGADVDWTAPPQSGTYTITCDVTDGRGGVAVESRTVTVSDMNVIIW